MPPRAAGTPLTQEDAHDLIAAIAQSSLQLNASMGHLTASQSSFMRSAADVDPNIGLSKAYPLLPVGLVDVKPSTAQWTMITEVAYQLL